MRPNAKQPIFHHSILLHGIILLGLDPNPSRCQLPQPCTPEDRSISTEGSATPLGAGSYYPTAILIVNQ